MKRLSVKEKAKTDDEAIDVSVVEDRLARITQTNDGETTMSKEKEFHNHRIAFYINKNNRIVFIKKGQSHIEYFNEIGHSEYINFVTRGYILDDHVMFYRGNDFEIPRNLTIKTILELVSSINKSSIKWVGLGCIIGNVGEEWNPKITIKINTAKY